MKISIITPTYNSAKTIVRNVQSVINQNSKEFEHILVDNLSSDESIQLVKKEYEKTGLLNHLKIIKEKDSGISDAFNKGIRSSTGDIISILNSDDYFFDEFVLEKVLKVFKNENILFVHGNIFFHDKFYGSNLRKPLLCPITEAMPYNHPTMFFKKNVYEKYGSFDTSYKYAMDYEFICRLEKTIPSFRASGKYIEGNALAVMSAGGQSWRYELESILEVKKALQQHKLWNTKAILSFVMRIVRVEVKRVLIKLRLNSVVHVWRHIKWNKRQ